MSGKWWILFAAWLAFFSSTLTRFLVPSILPTLSAVFDLDGKQAGVLTGAYWAAYAIFQIPAGTFADKHGAKPTLLSGLALTAIFAVAAAQAGDFFQLLAVQFLLGCTSAFIWAPCMVLLLNRFRSHEAATASGIFNMAFPAGAAFSFFASTTILQVLGAWETPFLAYAAVLSLSFLISAVFVGKPARVRHGESHRRVRFVRHTLSKKEIWLDAMARFGSGFAYLGGAAWATSYLVRSFDYAIAQAGAVGTLMTVSGIAGYPAGGIIADRILKRRALTVLIGMLGIGILDVAIALSNAGSIWLILAAFPILGFCYGLYGGPSASIVSEFRLNSRSLGFATSFVNFMTQTGGAISPMIFGVMLDATGSYSPGWATLGLVALLLSLGPAILVKYGY